MWYEQLEESIREMVDEKVGSREADDINGLEDMVKDIVHDEKLDLNTDDIEGFTDAVQEECGAYLKDNCDSLFTNVLKEDGNFCDFLKKLIRETIVELVSELVKGLVLKGQG